MRRQGLGLGSNKLIARTLPGDLEQEIGLTKLRGGSATTLAHATGPRDLRHKEEAVADHDCRGTAGPVFGATCRFTLVAVGVIVTAPIVRPL